MAINSNKYVQITSGVGGAAVTSARELLARIFTTNEQIPTGAVLKFSDPESVLAYFGSASEEYKRSISYFGFKSKAITSPRNINYARWADVDTSAQIFGSKADALSALQAITAGDIELILAGVPGDIVVDFSSAADYADVATELQTKIQALAGTFATTTVTYNALKTQFILDTNGVADGKLEINGLDAVIDPIGWSSLAIFSDGIATQTITDVLSNSTSLTNNFGSLVFTYNAALTIDQIEEASAWNVTRNNEFQYHVAVTKANAQAYFDALGGYAGCGRTIYDPTFTDEYHEMLPCALLASQDFTKPAAAVNYMYTQDSRLTPTVTDTIESNTFDAITTNYYGQTQEAGSQINFYQRGTLGGGSQDLRQMGVYANEQWLKSDLKAGFLNAFLAMTIIAADDSGRALALSVILETVEKANDNGAISQGKKLNNTQIQYIKQITGRDDVHFQVASTGSWYDAVIKEEVVNEVTEFYIDYTLIYAKRDAVNRVSGRHILI